MPPPPTPVTSSSSPSATPGSFQTPSLAAGEHRSPFDMASFLFSSRPQQSASRSAPSSTSAAMSPTIVMPQDWSVPSYLKHSVFYPRFTVSPSSLSPVASTSSASVARPGGSTGGSNGAGWGSATMALQSGPIEITSTSTSAAVRMPSQAVTAQERYQESLNSPHAKIPLPSKLDPKHCCKRLLIQEGILQFCPEKDDQGRDKLNRHDPEKDAAAVRADYPIPPQAGIYYFEVEIVSKGQKGYIGIGFSSRAVDLERLPGWNPESYGYHGDDGKAFACSGTGQAYSERFGSGDVIGCGIDFVAKRAFFVKNGKWLGYVFDLSSQLGDREDPTLKPNYGTGNGTTRRDRERGKLKETPGTAPLQFYPTIGLQTPGETVRVNFGQDPFKFDIESFVKRRQRETTSLVLKHSIPASYKQTLAPSFPRLPVSSSAGPSPSDPADKVADDNDDPHIKACMQNLIASYLNYRGYSDTARSFRKQREEERKQWRDVVAESSASFATATAAATAGTSESLPTGLSGSSTPVKKKGKKKAEGGSKKLLKSALRTTLSTGNEAGNDSLVDNGDSRPVNADEDEEMQSAAEQSSSTARPSRSASVRDDYMTTDVKGNSSTIDDLDADEAELEDTLHRQDICSALRRGRIDYAMQEIEEQYPGVIHPSSRDSLEAMLNGSKDSQENDKKIRRADLLFRLRCRKFVELVLASTSAEPDEEGSDAKMEVEQEDDEDEQVASQLISSNGMILRSASTAGDTTSSSQKGKGKANQAALGEQANVSFDQVLAYGSQLNALYPATSPATSPQILAKLKLLFSLVAYANPADLASHGNKDIYDLTRQEERDKLAEDVNKAMLESKGQPGIPHLELIYKQAHTVRDFLGSVYEDGRAAFVTNVVDT